MKTSLLVLTVLSVLTAHSQDIRMCGYQGYQTVEEVTSACDLQNTSQSNNSTEDAEGVVDAILDKVGLFRNFLIEECDNINNALAVTMPLEGGDIDRYILYDLEFFKKVSSSTGTDWGLTSILAHEVGHHLNGHTLKSGGSNHKVELQADEFSGFVLARMKCSLEDAQSAVSKLLPDEASATHPAKQDRLDAIAKGWSRGSGQKIEVKKISEIKEDSEITAEMVVARYIEAIGGEERIRNIKTFAQTQISGDFIQQYKYYTPSNLILTSLFKDEEQLTLLIENRKTYQKIGSFWAKAINQESTGLYNNVGYITEYSQLMRNVNMEYLGVKTIDGIECYAVEFEPEELKEDMIYYSTKYFRVDDGLLFYEKGYLSMEMRVDGKKETRESNFEKFIKSFREIDGVKFIVKK